MRLKFYRSISIIGSSRVNPASKKEMVFIMLFSVVSLGLLVLGNSLWTFIKNVKMFLRRANIPSRYTETVSNQRESGEFNRGKQGSVLRLSSTDDRHSKQLHNRSEQDTRSHREHEGTDSISDGIENQGSYLTGWENEKTVYLRGGYGERQSDTRSEAEFYNPLDTRHSNSNNSNRRNSQLSLFPIPFRLNKHNKSSNFIYYPLQRNLTKRI